MTERERILQQQNDAYDVMGADLSARLAAAEAQTAEINEWKNQAERERMAAEARCNEYVAQNMRQAQRLAALEEAARELNDLVFRGFRYTDPEIKKAHKRLAKLLGKGN